VDCPSCGATGQSKARCEACGFAFPQQSEGRDDDVLSLFLGLVCSSCDAYNDPGVLNCTTCGLSLAGDAGDEPEVSELPPAASLVVASPAIMLTSASLPPSQPASAPPAWMTAPSEQPVVPQAVKRNVDAAVVAPIAPRATGMVAPSMPASPLAAVVGAVSQCWRCQASLEPGDKFCRICGARVDGAAGQPAVAAGSLGTVALATSAASSAAAATQVIASLNVSAASPSAPSSASSTMVMPAMKLAQSAPSPARPPAGSTATLVFGAVAVERTAKLILVRGHTHSGSQWRLQGSETVIGRSSGMVLFPDDTALAHRHARLVWRGVDLVLEPEPTTNGVYIRLRAPARLVPGDEFMVGAQRLRVLAESDRHVVTAGVDDTRLLGSAIKSIAPVAPIALLKVADDDANHEVYFRAQRLLTIGRDHCDIAFPLDGFVSERHAQLTNEGNHLTLEDLDSRNGTYLRARSAVVLAQGDLLLLGDQVLRVEMPPR
jgi:pSer/pThr/pTyr-binding forkhead associated (FHA) protein